MKDKRYRTIFLLLLFFSLMLGKARNVSAAFPSDLGEKTLTAYDISGEDITVYDDAAMKVELDQVSSDGFLLKASDVSDDQKALYGTYENDHGQTGQGWISSGIFLCDADFQHVYATVRASMTIYSGSSLTKKRASIKKYSGIIALGRKKDAVQVIYETRKGYGIGWLSADNYSNTLIYDGRDKQILADGIYDFTASCGKSMSWEIQYAGRRMYRIFDQDQGQYLKISEKSMESLASCEDNPLWRKHGLTHLFKMMFDKEYQKKYYSWQEEQEKVKKEQENFEEKLADGSIWEDQEQHVFYELSSTEDSKKASLFYISRQEDQFTISLNKTDLFLDYGDKLTVSKADEDIQWSIRATKSMVDPENPMVFTQYDPQWCGITYGQEGCIGTAGCGLLATVNAVYALTGQYMSVTELMDLAVEKGYRIEGSGTSDGIFKASAETFGKKYGYQWDGSGEKISTLKKKLKEGKVAIVHVIGHYVAITSYDEKKDQFLLLDSNCLPKRKTSAFGDWISPNRLEEGYLTGQMYYYFALSEQ